MAKRTQIGTEGWYEVNRETEKAAYDVSAERGVDVREAIRMLIEGEADPAEYGLVEGEEESDADADE